MAVVAGMLVMAAGAVLAFALHLGDDGGFELNAVGFLLMAAAAVGFVLFLMFWSSPDDSAWRPGGYLDSRRC